jgi:DNA invertase Pin-like site-specific DNA recombinase
LEWKQKDGKQISRHYVTVKVFNRGHTTAKNCRVYLENIKSVHDGQTASTILNGAYQLSWPGWNFDGRELPATLGLTVEVISVDKTHNARRRAHTETQLDSVTSRRRAKMAVYGYCRVSTLRQANEGESLDVQRRQIEGYALMHALTLDGVMVEEGVSGSIPVQDRPAGAALFAKLKKGDIVIAAKLDRLFRSALDALNVVDNLKTRGVKLHLLDLGGDIAGNGLSKLFLTIAAAFAEAERDRIRERISQVKADQKTRGRFLGGSRPFGYRQGDNGELIPHEGEQAAVAEMVALRAQGKALRVIEAEMEAKGHKISHQGVARVLAAQEIALRSQNLALRDCVSKALPKASLETREEVARIVEKIPRHDDGDTLRFLQLVHDNLLEQKRVIERSSD